MCVWLKADWKNELVVLSIPVFLVASHHSKWRFGSGGACYCHKSIVFFLVRFLFSWKWKIGVWLQQPLSGLASLNTKHNTQFSSSSRIIVGNISKIIFAHPLPERKKENRCIMIDLVFEGSMNPSRWFNHFKSTISVRKNYLKNNTNFLPVHSLPRFWLIWFTPDKLLSMQNSRFQILQWGRDSIK